MLVMRLDNSSDTERWLSEFATCHAEIPELPGDAEGMLPLLSTLDLPWVVSFFFPVRLFSVWRVVSESLEAPMFVQLIL